MRGEEANGRTHLLSLLLLLVAIAHRGAECDMNNPPLQEDEEEEEKDVGVVVWRHGMASGQRIDEELICLFESIIIYHLIMCLSVVSVCV